MADSTTIEHKCPNCGATLEFDIDIQKVRCEYCGSEYDPSDLMVNEGNMEVDPSVIDLPDNGGEQWSDSDLSQLNEYSCSSCGSQLYADDTTSATVCPFCGSAVILKGRLTGSLKPDKVIPFKKNKEQALRILEKHCIKKHFVPKSFKDDRKLDEVKGLYVPYWIYDAEVIADMEYTGVKEKVLIPGKNSDLVELKYYRVHRKGRISFDHVPADGSSKMPDDLMESMEPYDYREADDFKTAYLSGYVADKYDVEQEIAAERVRERIVEETDDRFRDTIKGFDDVYLKDSNIRTEKSNVEYVLYPVWMFNLDWNENKYTYVVNGQTGKIAGNLPVDKIKLRAVSFTVFILLMIGAWWSFSGDLRGEELLDAMVFAGIICLIIEEFIVFWFKSDLQSVESRHGSDDYYREGSMKVDEAEEVFLYRKITTK